LDGSLEGGLPEVSEEVFDLLLALVDDVARLGGIDGRGHLVTQLLETATQLLKKDVSGEGRFGGHGILQVRKARSATRLTCSVELSSQRRRSRKICHTLRPSSRRRQRAKAARRFRASALRHGSA
jgi:hypothetical protein